MTDDRYAKLAKHLDNFPGGFPPTDSGVELRILRRLFDPEEARFALNMTLIPEEPRVVARRAGVGTREAALRLETMAQKGLLYRVEPKPGRPAYMAAQFVIGIWEFHVNDLDPELIRDMETYLPTLFHSAWKKPQLRTIPVGRSVHNELQVMVYEKAAALVERHDRFAISPCICRRERRLVGEGCDKPEDACLAFGTAADFAVKNGYGRPADGNEILQLLDKADEAGLVLQPGNSQQVNFICCCCGCCCGVLRTLKQLPKPAQHVSTAFVARASPETCRECGICETRCAMDALVVENGYPVVDTDRCIGCGLCVSTCSSGALILVRRPVSEQPVVPKNGIAAAIAHGRARGKLGITELVRMQARSKLDRFLATR